MSEEPRQNKGQGLVDRKVVEAPPPPPPSNFTAARPKAALLFYFFGNLDVVCCYLLLFLLYINIKIGKKDLLFWFFGDSTCGFLLFTVILVIYKYKDRLKRC